MRQRKRTGGCARRRAARALALSSPTFGANHRSGSASMKREGAIMKLHRVVQPALCALLFVGCGIGGESPSDAGTGAGVGTP
ncbi:MAG TPA: hypothetical protein VG496_04070, partial [Myxococcales bacterium]|nr:hypothetical protein [Myxococcales bacterium]